MGLKKIEERGGGREETRTLRMEGLRNTSWKKGKGNTKKQKQKQKQTTTEDREREK